MKRKKNSLITLKRTGLKIRNNLMISFTQYLKEQESSGTYIDVKPDLKSKQSLHDWASEQGIPNLIDPSQYHTTLVYSRKAFDPGYKELDVSFSGKIIGYDLFKNSKGTPALVLKLESPELVDMHSEYRSNHGATHDYTDYTPHVTLSYDVPENFKLEELPNFKVTYDKLNVSELDLDWASKVKKA